jgi:hypothetical protein
VEDASGLGRRNFLRTIGLLGVMTGTGLLLPGTVGANTIRLGLVNTAPGEPDEPTRDAFRGLAAFVVPGTDSYSTVQGTPRNEPGAVDAGTADFLIYMFDHFLPVPGDPSGATLPLSPLVAVLLNQVAGQVNPAATQGTFAAAFANLHFVEKAIVFNLLENPTPDLLAAISAVVPPQLAPVVGELLPYLVGGLLAFPGLGGYSEWSAFDAANRTVTHQPVGWQVSGYDPGVRDGWDDFIGYYQGRREVRR